MQDTRMKAVCYSDRKRLDYLLRFILIDDKSGVVVLSDDLEHVLTEQHKQSREENIRVLIDKALKNET